MAPISASTNEKALAAASRSKPLGDDKGREACARALTTVGFDANGAYSSQTGRMLSSKHVKVTGCCSGLYQWSACHVALSHHPVVLATAQHQVAE